MFKFLKAMFNNTVSKEMPFTSLAAIRDKVGNFSIGKILEGKYPAISIEKQVSGNYKVSQILEKTKTKIDFIVDQNGRVLSKEVLLGEGNSANCVIKGTKTLYSGDIINGVRTTVPTRAYIQYKAPICPEKNGFQNAYSKTSSGWEFKGATPINL